MNIENLQEWIDMPLGSSQAIDDRLWWIIRVPGGWVLLATNGSCFVTEPPDKGDHWDKIEGIMKSTDYLPPPRPTAPFSEPKTYQTP